MNIGGGDNDESVDAADEEDDFEEDDGDASDDNDQDVADSSVAGPKQAKRKTVRRCTRRVKSKLSGRNPPRGAQNIQQPPPVVDNREVVDPPTVINANRDLKYLLAQLRTCRNDVEKAQSMLTYLNGCSFNTGESPHGIIRFSNDEATELSRYVKEVMEKDEVTNKPEV